jgi:hypothetical protein
MAQANNVSQVRGNRQQRQLEWRIVSSGTNHFFNPHWRTRCPFTRRNRSLLEVHAEYALENDAEIFDHQNNAVDLAKILKR